MPGKILSILVKVGDEVVKGQKLLVTEAMKMETNITAPHDGTVSAIEVAVGEQVVGNDLLLIVDTK